MIHGEPTTILQSPIERIKELDPKEIAHLIGESHPQITHVVFFGSRYKGEANKESDFDFGVFIVEDDKGRQLSMTDIRGPIGSAIISTLNKNGYRVGKGPSEVDLEIMLHYMPKEQLKGLSKIVLEHSVLLFERH